MSKRVLLVILALSMLIGMISVTAFAESDYKYSKIAYYKDGSEVTGLTAGDITAKIKVKSATKTDELFFAMFLYKNNKPVGIAIDETPTAVASTAVQYEATINVPSDLTGVKLVTVLWEDIKDVKAVCSSSIVPSSEITLTELSVDGVQIDGFSPDTYEYEVVLTDEQMARSSAPWIDYIACDNGVKVEVTDPIEFPGESIVTVTSSDGNSSAAYTIKYKFKNFTGTSVVKGLAGGDPIKYNFNLPYAFAVVETTYTGGPEQVDINSYIAPVSVLTKLVLNRGVTGFISPLMYGKVFVPTAANRSDTTIALKRGAKVSVYCTNDVIAAYSAEDGWENDFTTWDTSAEYNWPDDETLPEEQWTYGEPSRIGDGLNEFPEGMRPQDNVGTKYDNRKQGWFYIDYRGAMGQPNRKHGFGSFSNKVTKSFPASSFDENGNVIAGTVSLGYGGSGFGAPLTVEYDDWTPSVNPNADLELN